MKIDTNQCKKSVTFYTLGCKVNQYETNGMAQKLKEQGYDIVNFDEKADFYIINTCSVTNESERKCRQVIRKAKQQNENAVLLVVGCYVNVEREKLETMEGIDLVLDNNQKKDIVKYIQEFTINREKEEKQVKMQNKEENNENQEIEYIEYGDITYIEKTRAMIKVQDGCNRFCSYCIIPYARGNIRSRKIENVISEITKIANLGVKEIVITGIHLASYKVIDEKTGKELILIDLLEEINKIEGIERIRLGSLEPKLITQDFIKRLIKLEKICDQFHLSLQSGSNTVLERMNRRYTVEEFRDGAKLLRNYYPNCNLTTDIIVGFPGETEEEFLETYNFAKEIEFYKLHVFPYSPKKGTKAAVMEGQIVNSVKGKRCAHLTELSNQMQKEINSTYKGKEIEVLFEETKDGYTKGHTKNYMVVKVKEDKTLENTIKKVVIGVKGEIIE